MTNEQAKDAFRKVFVAFPSYVKWIEQQADPIATLNAWCRLLSKCEASDVEVVVNQILDGTVNPRDKYDKVDTLPHVIRGRAMRMYDDRHRFKSSDALTKRPEKKVDHVHALPKLFAEVRRNNALVAEGKMSAEERDMLLLDIRRRARLTR